MDTRNITISTIDEYIARCPEEMRTKLEDIRSLIKKIVPKARETINYRMPAFTLNGKPLVYFALYKNHIGFYPTPSPIEKFKSDLSDFKKSEGAIQFPIDKPLPTLLIRRIIIFRMKEIMTPL